MASSTSNDVIEVDMDNSGRSNNMIKTDWLGPCIAFLFDFKFKGENICVLSHFSYSFDVAALHGEEILVKLLDFLVAELEFCLGINKFALQGVPFIQNMSLVVAGGVEKESNLIQSSLSTLNNINDFDIRQACDNDADICFLYYLLLNKVIIIKSVSKQLSNREESNGK